MDAVITGLFGLAVALLGIYGPRAQRAISDKSPHPPDSAVRDHETRLHNHEADQP